MTGFLVGLTNILMILTSLFLICLILIQRGKGGGLAGAFGGVGGSSAFGTKAGDVFTKVTIYVAIFWFVLAILLVWSSSLSQKSAFATAGASDTLAPDELPGNRTSSKPKDKVEDVPPIDLTPRIPRDVPNPGKAGMDSTTNAPVTPEKKP